MIETLALLATMTFNDVASLIAIITASIGLIVSLYKGGKKEAEENTSRLTKLEDDVKELKQKYTAMVTSIDKLNDALTCIDKNQAVMEVKLDQLQKDVGNVYETCTVIKKSLNQFMMETQGTLVKLQTEVSMLRSDGE